MSEIKVQRSVSKVLVQKDMLYDTVLDTHTHA